MRKAGGLLGLSDSYIAHIETGRMDPPQGDKLDRLLAIYGGIKQKSFFERVRNYAECVTPRTELMELVQRLPEEKIKTVIALTRALF